VNGSREPGAESNQRRRYDNSRRAAAARETRRRILDAAAACFSETGFDATSVRAIADRAATSPETIYAVFGTKVALLQAWIDQAITGDDEQVALRDREIITSLFESDDIDDLLGEFVRLGRTINERVAVPIQVARAAAWSSPELATLLAENERRRQDDFATAVERLNVVTSLPDGLSRDRAAQLIAALCSVDLYRSLVVEAGWTAHEYEARILHLVASTLGLAARRPSLVEPTPDVLDSPDGRN
jgi:AcrR family transcriptional regulator